MRNRTAKVTTFERARKRAEARVKLRDRRDALRLSDEAVAAALDRLMVTLDDPDLRQYVQAYRDRLTPRWTYGSLLDVDFSDLDEAAFLPDKR